jgi:ribosome biogenesis GTPase
MTPPDDQPKRGRKVRVNMRKNRGKAARANDWTRQFNDGRGRVDDSQRVENVRSKGSHSRKRTIIVGDEADESTLLTGLVVTMRGLVAEVDDGTRHWACSVRGKLRTFLIAERVPIAVGDDVFFSPVSAGEEESRFTSDSLDMPEGVIEKVAPRRTLLLRQYERRVQVVAANVDNAIITVAADQPKLRPHLIDRYLVAVHAGKMRPLICINKSDLDVDGFAADVARRYAQLGYKSLFISVESRTGLEELREHIRNTTSVFVGPSGVGKSSIINALEPTLDLKIGVLTDLERGKHTTTTARLLRWSFGGFVVDTPGMRQFDLAEVRSEELEAYFIEFVDLIPQCKYPNCTHRHETGCGIIAAVEAGRITQERYDSYCKMFEECQEREKY